MVQRSDNRAPPSGGRGCTIDVYHVSKHVYVQLSIGYDGSCADVGVVALADIPRGARLAVIPRQALLNATNSRVSVALRKDRQFQKQLQDMNSWVPLLLALLAEYGDKVGVV